VQTFGAAGVGTLTLAGLRDQFSTLHGFKLDAAGYPHGLSQLLTCIRDLIFVSADDKVQSLVVGFMSRFVSLPPCNVSMNPSDSD